MTAFAVFAPVVFLFTVALVGGHDERGRRRNFRESVQATFR